MPDFGVDHDILKTHNSLKDAEKELGHKLQASFAQPPQPPRDYFVPNFGVDKDIIATQKHIKQIEKREGHEFNPETLEMDNKRELTALGFDKDTFVPGDKLIAIVNPSRSSFYRENTMYLRAVEHQRLGFVYLHNVLRLYPIESDGDSLSRYMDEIN